MLLWDQQIIHCIFHFNVLSSFTLLHLSRYSWKMTLARVNENLKYLHENFKKIRAVGTECFIDGRRHPSMFKLSLNQLKSQTIKLLWSCGRPTSFGLHSLFKFATFELKLLRINTVCLKLCLNCVLVETYVDQCESFFLACILVAKR
jgi:hypothetical protein